MYDGHYSTDFRYQDKMAKDFTEDGVNNWHNLLEDLLMDIESLDFILKSRYDETTNGKFKSRLFWTKN